MLICSAWTPPVPWPPWLRAPHARHHGVPASNTAGHPMRALPSCTSSRIAFKQILARPSSPPSNL
eukprot:2078467-Pyramimonas_sp.AAC.3